MDFKTLSKTAFRGKPGMMQLTIRVVTPKNKIVPGTEVVLVSISDGFKMKGRSNASGEAAFFVPVNKTYEVDVDGNESLKTIDTPNMPDGRMTQFVFYEKLRITEITKGDTIVQKNITQENGTNTHLLFNLKLLNYDGIPLEGEAVYLQAEGQSRVYEAVTNKQGECKLMLQKNANYILNLKYEQGLQLVEAKNTTGLVMPLPDSHATSVTLMKPSSGPTDRSTDPRPAMTIGVSARVARISGADTRMAPASPAPVKRVGDRKATAASRTTKRRPGTASGPSSRNCL